MRFYTAERPWGDILPRYAFLEPILVDKSILEIGCGDGTGALFMKDRGARQILGLDQEEDLQLAKEKEDREGVSFAALQETRIDAPSASFDIVIDFDLAGTGRDGLMSEIQRVLKPTGF